MGVYEDQVLPRAIDVVCGTRATVPLRRRVCAGLAGEVVELGFGSGLNVPHLPPAVTGLTPSEPADTAWLLARRRVAASAVPVRRAGLDGASLPFGDDSFDAALSTWTLCTIPDVDAALAELRRVLRPGGTLHFLEHGLAPDARVRRWQRRLEPLQKRVVGGCHLTRETPALLRRAGFEITELDAFYEEGSPKFLGADTLGIARSA
jgi:SAM-dependent methyltransferase